MGSAKKRLTNHFTVTDYTGHGMDVIPVNQSTV